ncbi:hypothetical protein ABZ490_32420 [Streptomyces sp. NPDC005811]|uniref:hypothetical protein n=1 Tax=Streptomyces sp. NPDC005811 TaxID=3154565 RepID=UPI0033E69AC3
MDPDPDSDTVPDWDPELIPVPVPVPVPDPHPALVPVADPTTTRPGAERPDLIPPRDPAP